MSWSTLELRVRSVPWIIFKPSSNFLLTVRRRCFFCGFFFVICVCFCHTAMSVSCSLVVTCWETAVLFGLLYVMFSCVFVTSLYGVVGQVWYLIVSIPDIFPFLCSCRQIWILKLRSYWAAAWDFQQCGTCDQQRLRPFTQSDQSLC